MAKQIKCPICGKEFETDRPNKRYCSFTCKEAGQILRRMKCNEKNPNYGKEYMQKYRQKERQDNVK